MERSCLNGPPRCLINMRKCPVILPDVTFRLHAHNLQQSFVALLDGRPRFSGFFGVSPRAMHAPKQFSIYTPASMLLFSRRLHLFPGKQVIDTCGFRITPLL